MKDKPLILSLFGAEALAEKIRQQGAFEMGSLVHHHFPDGESLIRIDSDLRQRVVVMVANLADPDPKILPLLFAAQTAKSLGAKKLVLVAPYLVYMRQDKVFAAGQGITSSYFAQLISAYFDRLITVDPHLHRWPSLDALYQIPSQVLHATSSIAAWIKREVKQPGVLIGPDAESRQWLEQVASVVEMPFIIAEKQRDDDNHTRIRVPDLYQYQEALPILIDDIISSGGTLLESIKQIKSVCRKAPLCITVHAVFANQAYQSIMKAGVSALVSCNTIPHVSNQIDISGLLTEALI